MRDLVSLRVIRGLVLLPYEARRERENDGPQETRKHTNQIIDPPLPIKLSTRAHDVTTTGWR